MLCADLPSPFLGPSVTLNSTTVAFIGLAVLLVTGVLSWDDVLKEKGAWDTVVWFSALVMMATFLNKLGLIQWFSDSIETGVGDLGLGWLPASALLVLIYLYAHYLFASTTAHITAMFAAFYGAGLARCASPAAGADHGRCLQHHDDADPLRHRQLPHHLRPGLHDAGPMVEGRLCHEPGAHRRLGHGGSRVVEAAGVLVIGS